MGIGDAGASAGSEIGNFAEDEERRASGALGLNVVEFDAGDVVEHDGGARVVFHEAEFEIAKR